MNIDTTLEQRLVFGPTVVAPLHSSATSVAFLPTTAMPFSIRLRLPIPDKDVGTGGLVRFLLAIKELAVDRFEGAMHSWHEGRPADGSPPDPWLYVVLTFDDTVNPLEVTEALDRLYDHAESIALGKNDVE